LPTGEANRASHWMIRLPHESFRSGGVSDPSGPDSLGGGSDAGGTMREGVGEASGVVWCFLALAVLEVGLVGRRSSSSSDGLAAFGEGPGPLGSASVLLHPPPPPPPHDPVSKT
jgi:hypothetical protein